MFDKLRYIKDIRAELLNIEYNAKQIEGLTESQWVAIRASHRLLGKYLDALSKPSFSFNSDEQEQPEVGLDREIIKYKVPFTDESEYLNETTLDAIARHFYELGQRTKYQQDREEFAKLKAKEWQSGYDEGYMKGINARKEE